MRNKQKVRQLCVPFKIIIHYVSELEMCGTIFSPQKLKIYKHKDTMNSNNKYLLQLQFLLDPDKRQTVRQ